MAFISVVSPCYNEEGNVRELYQRVRKAIESTGPHTYEHIFIDNCSRDGTPAVLRQLAAEDPNVKVIFNARNFGHIRSPFHAVLQTSGDAVICMASDLQDPPEMLAEFVKKWEEGYKVVKAVKNNSEETWLMFLVRKTFYTVLNRLSEVELTKNYTGFGLYDRKVIEVLRQIDDPYPYFRGLISEIGFEAAIVNFTQPTRKRGLTKNNFYTLYDIGMLGITNHTKVPLRLAIFGGFTLAVLSLIVGFGYLIFKLIFWNWFQAGTAPIIISIFFFAAVQLFFMGILGEYIGAIHTQVQKRPLVIERDRINFDKK